MLIDRYCEQCSLWLAGVPSNQRFCTSCRDDRRRAAKRRWRNRHLEDMRTKSREFMAQWRATPEGKQAYRKWFDDGGQLKLKIYTAKRRCPGPGEFTVEDWVALVERTGSKCLACDTPGTPETLTIDHVLPGSKGGDNWITNIQPLCGPCNYSKQDRHIDYRAEMAQGAACP